VTSMIDEEVFVAGVQITIFKASILAALFFCAAASIFRPDHPASKYMSLAAIVILIVLAGMTIFRRSDRPEVK
jgi:hypothetical protein